MNSDSAGVNSDSVGVNSDSAGVNADSAGANSDSAGVNSNSAGGRVPHGRGGVRSAPLDVRARGQVGAGAQGKPLTSPLSP
eukprot:6548024-Pyramimonas_sp.AAC.2